MCGIIGYIGNRNAESIVVDALRHLEYRGYDSAGIATIDTDSFSVRRAKGKLDFLQSKLNDDPVKGQIGIGHTRWATHGKPSEENAHPHKSERIAVVHNGIIENYVELKSKLSQAGYDFVSQTDTEIIPILIDYYLQTEGEKISFEEAVFKTVSELKGAFAFAAICLKDPDRIIAAKNASPLIVGLTEEEGFLASDIPALLDHTRDVSILEDGEVAIIERGRLTLKDFEGKIIEREPKRIEWSRVAAKKDGFKHFMLKEIFEQPRAIADSLRSRLMKEEDRLLLNDITPDLLTNIRRIIICACGTSYHAGLVGKFWIEDMAKIPVEVDLASEFRYRKPVVNENDLFVAISQSGETADTLAALEEAKRLGAKVLSVSNCVDSSIPRKSDCVIYTQAGPEIGVASTKAFTTQLTAMALVALKLAEIQGTLAEGEMSRHIQSLRKLASIVEESLKAHSSIEALAAKFTSSQNFLFLARGSSYPIALEGALKLKEISYIHAEGYAAGEMKHGPIALIDHEMPVLFLASGGASQEKAVNNLQEVCSRGGRLIVVATEGDHRFDEFTKDVITIPSCDDFTRPIVETIPLQLLAYHIANQKGTDVDQPRNLAKSVTVE